MTYSAVGEAIFGQQVFHYLVVFIGVDAKTLHPAAFHQLFGKLDGDRRRPLSPGTLAHCQAVKDSVGAGVDEPMSVKIVIRHLAAKINAHVGKGAFAGHQKVAVPLGDVRFDRVCARVSVLPLIYAHASQKCLRLINEGDGDRRFIRRNGSQ